MTRSWLLSARPLRSRRGGQGNRGRYAALCELGWFVPLVLLLVLTLVLTTRSSVPQRLSLVEVWGSPSTTRPFGSAEGGIDVAAFVGHACVRVLVLSAAVATLSCLVGVPIGALAAIGRGKFETLLVRTCDLFQSFPTFLLALVVLSAVEVPSRWHLGVVFTLTAWAPFARMAHAQARWVVNSEFVLAARALGANLRQILFRHLIPHLVGPMTVQLGSCAAGVVLGESALGFVGLGPSDGVSLGALLEQGTVAMLRAPRVLVIASLAIAATSGALQLTSEGLRRRLLAR
jgi:peptide/nickel transport system permease protein